MKVQIKHHDYFGVFISSNQCTIQGTMLHMALEHGSDYGDVYFNPVTLHTKIESTWYAVVQFIRWHNSLS